MSALTLVLVVVWATPIVAVAVAYIRLSRRIDKELAAMTENRAAQASDSVLSTRIALIEVDAEREAARRVQATRRSLEIPRYGPVFEGEVFTISSN